MRPVAKGSDHCPAMKGIETGEKDPVPLRKFAGSDHCPAMKGIETGLLFAAHKLSFNEATTAPQ